MARAAHGARGKAREGVSARARAPSVRVRKRVASIIVEPPGSRIPARCNAWADRPRRRTGRRAEVLPESCSRPRKGARGLQACVRNGRKRARASARERSSFSLTIPRHLSYARFVVADHHRPEGNPRGAPRRGAQKRGPPPPDAAGAAEADDEGRVATEAHDSAPRRETRRIRGDGAQSIPTRPALLSGRGPG
jgi:hypothetical protein